MSSKSLHCVGFLLFAAAALHGQATYYSATQPDCSSLGTSNGPIAITNSSNVTLGYSCYVSGTFVWYDAGGGWNSSIRMNAPASGAVFVDYLFYDRSGNAQSLDTAVLGNSTISSGSEYNFVLAADQPSEIDLFGLAGTGPNYTEAWGSVYATIYCPDANTCSDATPQLIYSALPSHPWSISVPISWDQNLWTQWSAGAVDDGSTNIAALVIYNQNSTASSYTVKVFDSNGNLAGSGVTPPIPPLQALGGGNFGEGGTSAVLLSQIVKPLPSGIFKILVDGGTQLSSVEVLQFKGPSATSLQVAYDSAPAIASAAKASKRAAPRRALRQPAPPAHGFPGPGVTN